MISNTNVIAVVRFYYSILFTCRNRVFFFARVQRSFVSARYNTVERDKYQFRTEGRIITTTAIVFIASKQRNRLGFRIGTREVKGQVDRDILFMSREKQ